MKQNRMSVSIATALGFALLLPINVMAQRDPPVWSSFLSRIEMFNERTSLEFEVTHFKGGGPKEQASHAQMYVLAYLAKDEPEVLKFAAREDLTDKKNPPEELLLHVLQEKKLCKLMQTVAVPLAKPERNGKRKDKRKVRGGYSYDFEFALRNSDLLDAMKELKSFDGSAFHDYSVNRVFEDKLKLMIFVPTNDSGLATKVPQENQKHYDLAHQYDSRTVVQYLKPLPHRFTMSRLKDGTVLRYTD